MLLLTGATGTVGRALLARLIERRVPVRCLVRDPRRLGPERVRVQIALGDLADPPSFRNALRGVDTVVHLAAATRDQTGGSIEELNALATWRLVEAAQRARVRRFVFASALGASETSRARLLRSKARAERVVLDSGLDATVLATSLVVAPDDERVTLLRRLALLGVTPMSGRGHAAFQPIWAGDVAECFAAVLNSGPRRAELAGPETLTHRNLVALVSGRPVVGVPTLLSSRALRVLEAAVKSKTPVTWDEVELLEVGMTSARGTADAVALGVHPRAIADVLRPAHAA